MNVPTLRARRIAGLLAIALVPAALAAPSLAKGGSRRAVAHGANARPASARHLPSPRMYRLHHGAGEPTIGFTKSGTIYFTASDGCVSTCPGSDEALSLVAPGGRVVLASADKGKTWEDRTPGIHPVSPHVISLDPYLFVDTTPEGSRIFDLDSTLACAELSFSDDEGKTWLTNPLACGEPVNDHQTLFAGPPVSSPTVAYPKVLYYCFNHPEFTKCSKSLDGGLSFMPTANIVPPECSGLNGHGVTDAKGTVYVPLGSCGQPKLAISTDEADNWKVIQVAPMPSDGGGDPSVAVDEKGTLYYLFVGAPDRLPYLVTSKD
ncbi:MAG: sialidase family protein, partial [Mycobacteriales bacterium]